MDAVIINLGLGVGLQNVIGWFPPIVLGLANVIPLLMAVYFYADKKKEYEKFVSELNPLTQQPPEQSYDFIVVGAGTAGCIVANRLSQRFSVLLLEKGGQPNPLTTVPGMETSMTSQPEIDYNYLTVPQNSSCFACNNNQVLFNAGFGLGGTSILSALAYIRAHPFDYDRWANYTQDARWNYTNILPYFKRSEHYCDTCENSTGVKPSMDPRYHGFTGELPVRPLPISPLVPEFLEAIKWAGMPKQDINAPYFTSIGDVLTNTQANGRRITAYNAFVEPILDKRPQLRVLKYANVIRVLFKPGTNEAIGVEYERFGHILTATAKKEVILSAGAVASPKILLLSGIGPAQELAQVGIHHRLNLPVGRNLGDQIGSFVGPFLINKPLSIMPERDMGVDAAKLWVENGTGPFSITFARGLALWASDDAVSKGKANWPDTIVGFASTGVAQNMDQILANLYNFKLDVMSEFFGPVKGKDAFSLIFGYGQPQSRGVIKLKSADYKDDPLIDPGYYTDPNQHDIKVAVQTFQKAVHICENAPSFKNLGSTLSPVPFPPCKHLEFRSAEYWECVARQYTVTLHHYHGTVPMGPKHSPRAVLDSELRVIGAKGLRVMDASVMPITLSVNPWAATMMIAERGSDFVIQEWVPAG